MKVHKKDSVLVIAGNFRGKTGKVLKIFPEKARLIVEGINIIKRHTKPSQRNPQGGIIQKEAPIHISNVMVICPKCNEPSRLGRARVTDTVSGRRRMMRVCKNCGEMF